MIRRLLPVLVIILLAGVVATPVLWLETTVSRARACFARQLEPRGPELPDCVIELGVLKRLEDVPLMARHAERVREEMVARMAFRAYVDAAVGTPDRRMLAERLASVADAHRDVIRGTGRLVLDELGPLEPVLGAAELAMRVGDAVGLDAVADRHAHHAATRRAIEEALLRGDLERARALAERHVGRPDEELRLVVASLLCATRADAARGTSEARQVELRRAKDRKANFSRSFGSARVVVEACAHLGNLEAPELPGYGYAGDWDHRARLMALRMRLFRDHLDDCDLTDPSDCRADPVFAGNVDHLLERLRYRKPRRYRLETLASVVEAVSDPAEARRLAAELPDEPRHEDRMAVAVADWVDPPQDEPFLTAEAWARAAQHVASLRAAEPDRTADDGDLDALRRVERAMWWRAAMVHALAGRLDMADDALSRAEAEPERRQLGATLAALVSGDRQEAGRRMALASPEAWRRSPLASELAMPDRDEARRRLPAATEQRAWLEVVLGDRAVPVAAADPPRLVVLGPPRLPQSDAAGRALLDRVLDRWSAWLAAGPDERRAHRFRLWRHGGDLPKASALSWIVAAGRLIDEPAAVETWLDAALAIDRARLSLRRYAMLRWRAAAWRSDVAAAERWRARYRRLARQSVDRNVAELMRAAGI